MREPKRKVPIEAQDPEMAQKIGNLILKVCNPALFAIVGIRQHPTKPAMFELVCEFIGSLNKDYLKEAEPEQ